MAVLTVTYNGQAIPHIGTVEINRSYAKTTVACDLLFEGTPAGLTGTENSAIAALTAWNEACTIVSEGTMYSITGMIARPRIYKSRDGIAGEAARQWRWECDFEEPASSNIYFVREASIALGYDAARKRTVTIDATFTANPGSATASANALANGPTYAEVQINAILGESAFDSFDVVNEGLTTRDGDVDSVCTWRGVYKEQFEDDTYPGASSIVIDTVMTMAINASQTIGVAQVPPAGASIGSPLANITAVYMSTIDVPAGWTGDTDAVTLYRGSIRPHLFARIAALLNLDGSIASMPGCVQDETFKLSRTAGTIEGTIRMNVPRSRTEVVEFDETLTVTRDENELYDALWDGQDHTFAIWGIGADETAEQITRVTRYGIPPDVPPKLGSPWRLRVDRLSKRSEMVGNPATLWGDTSGQAQVHRRHMYTWTRAYRRVESTRGGGGGGGGGGVITPGESAGANRQVNGGADSDGVLVRIDAQGNAQIVGRGD